MSTFQLLPVLTLKDDGYRPTQSTETSSLSQSQKGDTEKIIVEDDSETTASDEITEEEATEEEKTVFGYDLGSKQPVDENGLMHTVIKALRVWKSRESSAVGKYYFAVAYLLKGSPRFFNVVSNVENYVQLYAEKNASAEYFDVERFDHPDERTLIDLHNSLIYIYPHGRGFPRMRYEHTPKSHQELQQRVAQLYYNSMYYEGLEGETRLTLQTALSRNCLITDDAENLTDLNYGLRRWWSLGGEETQCPFVFVLGSDVKSLSVGDRNRKVELYAKDYLVYDCLQKLSGDDTVFTANNVLTYHMWSECLKTVDNKRNRDYLVNEWVVSNRSMMSLFLDALSELLNPVSSMEPDSYRGKWRGYYEELVKNMSDSKPVTEEPVPELYATHKGKYLTMSAWRSVSYPFRVLWKPVYEGLLKSPPFVSQYPFHPTDIDNTQLYQKLRGLELTYDYSKHYESCDSRTRTMMNITSDLYENFAKGLKVYMDDTRYDSIYKYYISAVYSSLYYDDLSRKHDPEEVDSSLLDTLSGTLVISNLIQDGYLRPLPETAA